MTKLLLPFFCVFLCSCASILDSLIEKPKVELDSVDVQKADLKGATLLFKIAVNNPNNMEIKVDQISYKVFVNNKEITKAHTDKVVAVAGKSTSIVELPLPLEYSKIFTDLKDLVFAKDATYKIEGDAKLKLFTIPFLKEGKVQLR